MTAPPLPQPVHVQGWPHHHLRLQIRNVALCGRPMSAPMAGTGGHPLCRRCAHRATAIIRARLAHYQQGD